MKKLLVVFSLILALFGSSVIVNAAVQKGTVNISSTLDGSVLTDGSDSQIDMGSVLNLNATAIGNGNVFAFWIVNGFVRTDLPAETQLRVQSKMNLVAVFRSADKHAVLFVDSNGKLIDDVYVANGETATAPSTTGLTKPGGLTVVADEANRWISLEGNTSLAGINSSRVYVLQYTEATGDINILVEGGLVGSIDAVKNQVVVAVAANSSTFTHWVDENDNVLSYNPTFAFTALEDTKLFAKTTEVTPTSFVSMQDLTGIRSGHVSYMGRYELYGGDELVEFGFIYGNTIGDIEMGMPNVAVAISNVANPATNEFLMSFVDGHHVTARAYAIVRNGEAIRTIYSDLVVKPSVQEIEAIRTTSGAVTSYGIVSGIMGTKYVFVQQKDGSAAIVMYNVKDLSTSGLKVGDEVIISGTMGTYNGLIQVAAGGTIQILNSGNTVPLAENLGSTLKTFTVGDQSKRFDVSGLTVVSASGQNLVVKDASNIEITVHVDLSSYTDLVDLVNSLSAGDIIDLNGIHLDWSYGVARFKLINVNEVTVDPLSIENKIKSSITTELDGKSFNEGSNITLPSELFGVSISWTTNPVDLISGGVFKDVEADLTGATATAVFTVPGRDEVTQVATFTIKDVPAGAEEYFVTAAYSGTTTTNMVAGNNAAVIGLDPLVFSVTATKGGQNNFPGLNKSGQIRLYASSGNGNELFFTISGDYIIKSVDFVFGSTVSQALIKTGDVEAFSGNLTSNGTKSFTDLSVNTVSIKNTGTAQIYILSIVITYRAK